jgi:2-hydroxychromene-2-carboxylate isomerase
MTTPLTFYFDFSSPYGYLASTRIDALAAKHGRSVNWKPMLLGAAFKVTGQAPLPMVPLKGDYSKHDFARSARYYGIAFRQPSVFPIASQAPSRAFYWLNEKDPAAAKKLAAALYRAYFLDDVNISNPSDTVAVAAKQGHSAAEVETALNDPAVKEKVKLEVDAAIAKGVFGSPFVFIDDEPFWGMDRFDQIERWLASDGF